MEYGTSQFTIYFYVTFQYVKVIISRSKVGGAEREVRQQAKLVWDEIYPYSLLLYLNNIK